MTIAVKIPQARRAAIRYRRFILGQVARHLALIAVGAFFFLPWFWMVSTSLKPLSQVFRMPPQWIPNPVEWENYVYAVTAVPLLHYLRNTLFIATIVVIGQLLSSSLVAYSFACVDWKGRDKLFLLVLATMMLPGQVTMIPIFIIFTRLGWINTFLPLTVPAFFGDAFFIFMMRQFFMTIPKDLTDSARLDGASHFDIYLRLVMPLARPALATLIAFTFIWTFTDFQGPLIYLKDRDLWTLSLGMRGYLQRYGAGGGTAMGAMMAAATLYTLPMIIIFFAAQKTFIQGVVTTGLK